MEIEVVPPDVNRSRRRLRRAPTARSASACRAIKGCGGGGGRGDRRRARQATGPSRACSTSASGSTRTSCNRATIETLIKAGAFDSLGGRPRAAHGRASSGPCSPGAAAAADRRSGQKGLFDDDDDEHRGRPPRPTCPTCPSGKRSEQLAMEKEVLGFYLSSHPLAEHEATLAHLLLAHQQAAGRPGAPQRGDARRHARGDQVLAHQEPQARQRRSKYAMFDLEDMDGIVRCILWPEQFAQFGELVSADAILGRPRRGRPPARQRGGRT